MLFGVLLLSIGCKEVSRVESQDIDAAGLTTLRAYVERGTFTYALGAPDSFGVRAESWGRASGALRAGEREAANFLDVVADGSTLSLDAGTGFRRAGWDVEVFGPEAVNLDVTVVKGDADVEGASGVHHVEADRVVTRQLAGDVDLVANLTGVDAELLPPDGGAVTINSYGGVVLWLPPFQPYDILITADAGQLLTVDDIGFDSVDIQDGSLTAWRSPGTIRVRVSITQGGFELHEAL